MTLQGQTNGTILWPPRNHTTFVGNIFLSRAWFSRYSTGWIKMGHPVYIYIYICVCVCVCVCINYVARENVSREAT